MPSVRVRNRAYSVVIEAAGSETRDAEKFLSASQIARPLRNVGTSEPESASYRRDRGGSQDSRQELSLVTAASQDVKDSAGFQRGSQESASYYHSARDVANPTSRRAGLTSEIDIQPDGRRARHMSTSRSPVPGPVDPPAVLSRLAAALGVDADVEHHEDAVVEHLDVIDAQVSVVNSLTDAANTICVPPIPFVNRAQTVDLVSVRPPQRPPSLASSAAVPLPSESTATHELDHHFYSLLCRKEAFKRGLHGLWTFLKTRACKLPTSLGFESLISHWRAYSHPQIICQSFTDRVFKAFTAIYGFLVAFWGAAIFLFLTRIINLHDSNRQNIWIEITSQVETGLFTLTGVGLIPWRVLDTYRIMRIWHYKRVIIQRRRQEGLSLLIDQNDLFDSKTKSDDKAILTEEESADLRTQQQKFAKSQTWYRAHATATHRASPITSALWICLFIDGNSVFQCILCGTMWGLNRHNRPSWTTGSLIPASFLCGIAAAVIIWRVGKSTRKTEEVEKRLRETLDVENWSFEQSAMWPGNQQGNDNNESAAKFD